MKREELFEICTAACQNCLDIMKAKNHDYATGDQVESDALKNFKLVEYLGITDVETGIMVRLCDKFARLANVYDGDIAVSKETVDDTLDDIINYCNILRAVKQDK